MKEKLRWDEAMEWFGLSGMEFPKHRSKCTGLVGNPITESNHKGDKIYGGWVRHFHRVTQQKVGEGVGFGGCAKRTTKRQHQDWSPAGDKTDRGYPYTVKFGLQGTGGRGGENTLGRDCHSLDRRDG